MLKVHFINVAEGDATLFEFSQPDGIYRLLIDDGHAQLEPTSGSARNTALQYLQNRQISHLDALVITHLHLDHFGATAALAENIRIDDVYASYFPPRADSYIENADQPDKERRKLQDCLDLWARNTAALRQAGSRLHTVDQDTNIATANGLDIRLICPSALALQMQRKLFDDMYAGKPLQDKNIFWASKSRNPASLRTEIVYAGRRIEMAADCYGRIWENEELLPCDILKIPHHADAKSLTAKLVDKLHPRYAVATCGKDYIERKDRPSAKMIAYLTAVDTRVYFTDSFAFNGQPANVWPAVIFTIDDDGTIKAPQSEGKKG